MSGEVPEGWRLTKLGEIAALSGGTTPPKSNDAYWTQGDVPWATPSDITSLPLGQARITATEAHVAELALKECSLKLNPTGTVLMTSRATIGYAVINEVPMATNQGFLNFTCFDDCDPQFLCHWLNANRGLLTAAAGGSTFKELSRGTAKLLPIFLPPHSEQRRIAEVLMSVDHALRAQATLHSQTSRVLRSAREGLLDTFRSDWPRRRFGDVARTYAGGTPPRNRADYYAGSIPWLKSGEVRGKRISETEERITLAALNETSARMAKAGSPVIAMYGATAGVVGMLDIDAAINQAVLAVEPLENLDSRFCVHVLEASGQRLLRTVQGSGQPNLSKRIIDDLEIGLPPLHTQQDMADVLDSLEATLADHQSTLSGLNGLKARLASDLLSGRVRVPA